MNAPKKKLINFRPVFCCAVIMITAIIFVCKIFISQTSRLVLLSVLLISIIASTALLIYHKKKYLKILLSVLIAFFIPVMSVYIKSERINANHALNVENCVIYGKIYKINEKLDNNVVDVYLTDIELAEGKNKLDFYGNYLIKVNTNNFDISKLSNGKYISCYSICFNCSSRWNLCRCNIICIKIYIKNYVIGNNTI